MPRDDEGRAMVYGLLLRAGWSAAAVNAGMAAFDRGESAEQCQEECRRAEQRLRANENADIPESLSRRLWLPPSAVRR